VTPDDIKYLRGEVVHPAWMAGRASDDQLRLIHEGVTQLLNETASLKRRAFLLKVQELSGRAPSARMLSKDDLARLLDHLQADIERSLQAPATLEPSRPLERAEVEQDDGGASQDPAQRVPGYVLGSKLGEGGFGVVYEAQTSIAPYLAHAVKILEPLPFQEGDGRERFMREVEAVHRLSHRAIVRISSAGFTTDGAPFIAMEHVSGELLHEIAPRLTFEERVGLMAEVLRGLQHAHDQGILHRDVKPPNIIVRTSDRQPVLLDFGTAYVWDGFSSVSLTATLIGSLGYIPPEVQADPKHRSATHDVFSAGVTLYEIIANRRPNPQAPAPLAEIDPSLAALDHIVRRSLAAEPERFETCGEFEDALNDWLGGRQAIKTLPPSKMREELRQRFTSQRRAEDAWITAEQRRKEGLAAAMAQIQPIVESLAESALRDIAQLLDETRGEKWKLTTGAPNRAWAGVEPLYVLSGGGTQGQQVVVARTSAFSGILRRHSTDPLVKWPDENEQRALRLPSPPQQLAPPHWLVFDDRGGSRSPSVVIWGAIVASIARIDPTSSSVQLQLHARPVGRSINRPLNLNGPDQIREYWLAAVGIPFQGFA
jgi:serine/threonine protein kinase